MDDRLTNLTWPLPACCCCFFYKSAGEFRKHLKRREAKFRIHSNDLSSFLDVYPGLSLTHVVSHSSQDSSGRSCRRSNNSSTVNKQQKNGERQIRRKSIVCVSERTRERTNERTIERNSRQIHCKQRRRRAVSVRVRKISTINLM